MPLTKKPARRWIASAIAAASEPLPSMPWAQKAARNSDQLIEQAAYMAQTVVYPRRAILLAH